MSGFREKAEAEQYAKNNPNPVRPNKAMKFQIYQDAKKEWRFKLIGRNGNIIASGESYKRAGGVMKTIRAIKKRFLENDIPVLNESGAEIVGETQIETRKLSSFELELKKAIRGLFYLSETDAPFKLITRDGLPFGKAETIPFEDFFGRLTKHESWFEQAEIGQAIRFEDLQQLMEAHLYDLTVVKVAINDSERMFFVFGKNEKGNVVGLEVLSIET